jgi:hypothetical protein
MPASNGGRSGGNQKKKDGGLMDNLRGACPPHKKKDFDELVKTMNGDEAKIMAKIQEWWEGSPQAEEIWEDVNKAAKKKKPNQVGGGSRGGGRSQGPGRGRGRNDGGGRGGGGRDSGARDRGGRGRGAEKKQVPASQPEKSAETAKKTEQNDEGQAGIAPLVTTDRAPKGAWGARATMTSDSPPAEPAQMPLQPKPEESALPLEANPLEVGMFSQNDPPPSGLSNTLESKPVAVPVSGNVWATKGSAHLIHAAKPKLPAPATVPIAYAPPTSLVEPELPPAPTEPLLESGLQSGLPPAVTVSAGGAWSKGAPTSKHPSSSPAAPQNMTNNMPSVSSVVMPVPVSPEPAAPVVPLRAAPANVLNMGHWETGDTDDAQHLDFAFGSFGVDNDAVDDPSPAAAKEVSPARPPPGLSLGGMPPMPDAVMVHELENKMANASMNSAPMKDKPEDKPSLPQESHAPAHALPSGGVTQHNYNQYGMPGMYNYNAAAGNGFVGMHTPAGPVLAGGAVPQQHHGKPQVGGMPGQSVAGASVPQNVPQQGLYGSLHPAAPSAGNPGGNGAVNGDNGTAPAGIPPGMPGTIPYGNPALHYGQPQFYMGQQQGGIGYNYAAYGQFGGVAQGGFGYQQMMGQNQGYGAPHYDDQSHQGTAHHAGGAGQYQKNSGGGYRGRNAHHNNNQYQNQYNPQQQQHGYGGQPYNMGYQDHFNQRGAYGPGGMGDPYGMQQGNGNYQPGGAHAPGNFQDDDQKGKKGGRGNGNSSLQQFQQQAPPAGFGLPGQGSEPTPSSTAGAGGWSNQAGGWSGGGAPSWQGS